jgi:hypothetical protein
MHEVVLGKPYTLAEVILGKVDGRRPPGADTMQLTILQQALTDKDHTLNPMTMIPLIQNGH